MVELEGPATALADALLAREAVRCRALRGTGPDPLAGVRIDDAAVDRLITELTEEPAATPATRSLDASLDRARAGFAASLAAPGVLAGTVVRAKLDPVAAEVLALLVAIDLDPRRQRLLAYIQDDITKVRPTCATLLRLFGPPGALAVAPASRLRRAGLVSVDDGTAWGARTVALATGVTWAVVGDDALDPDLPVEAKVRASGTDVHGAFSVLVFGPDRVRRLDQAFDRAAGSLFLVTPAPAEAAGWPAIVREATLGGLGIVLEVEGELSPLARWWIERADHLPWAISSQEEIPLSEVPDRSWVECRAGDPEASGDEWGAVLGAGSEHGYHRLTAEQLNLVTKTLPSQGGDLDAAVRRLASGPLDRLARRIRPRRTWDDLILTADRVTQLQELAARYRHRDTVYRDWGFPSFPSSGLVALFSGPSGTGKTLAAEIVAGELGLDLYKLELSSVVSKYIGETEKNLEQVFSAASAGNLVLFFDEADSLFGKRSEVSDARDRYANIEVSYLLQRIEAYDGLIVLATNFQKNIDEAFLRRIHVLMDFALPEETERDRLWRHAFPPSAPTKDLDFDFLARQFKLSGGNISGAALHAAFLAADAGEPITMELVMLALKREFQKLGRLRTEAEFGRYAALVSGP